MKTIFFFLYALVIGFIAIALYFNFKKTDTEVPQIKIPFIGSQFSIENAPSDSIKGRITSLSGDVDWQSRIATQESELKSNIAIQQGESVVTREDGKLSLEFGKESQIDLLSKTKVEIIQTLANNLVFNQASGSATYKKTGTSPVSIRTKHLLIDNNGQVSISIDEISGLVTVKSIKGIQKAAFNDLEYISNIVLIEEGKDFIFNDDTRQVDLE